MGITVETDPTVPASIKDGISWSEIASIPAGFADGVDDIGGITVETDPQVGTNTLNYLPKWNGSALVTGSIYDNGKVGIGTTSPQVKLSLGLDLAPKKLALWDGVNDFYGLGVDWGRMIFSTNNTEKMTITDTGNVGIGTAAPDQKLHVIGKAHFDLGTGHINISTPGGWPGVIAYSQNGNRRDIHFYDTLMTITVSDSSSPPSTFNGITVGENGSLGVGIGTTLPSEKLDVAGNIKVNGNISIPSNSNIINASGREVFHTGWSGGFGDYTSINSGYDWGSDEPVSVVAGSNGVFFTKGDASGTPYKETLASINTSGRLSCDVLEIKGGSDIAEPFEVQKPDNIKAGTVMAIDPENPGKLRISDHAYDRRVAGVVSGAGGVNPGMLMQQKGSPADGATPIALTGRVYCWTDASNGRIEPGDLLTTSETPGHAMKVTDYARAQGAILGKAMSTLEKDTGLVLVLVTLQ